MTEPSASRSERFTLSPERYALGARIALWMLTLIVLTGAAVRVTGSGLGCPTWPKCTQQSIYSELNTHGIIEFGNPAADVGRGLRVPGGVHRRSAPAGRRDLVLLGELLPLGVAADRARWVHGALPPCARVRACH